RDEVFLPRCVVGAGHRQRHRRIRQCLGRGFGGLLLVFVARAAGGEHEHAGQRQEKHANLIFHDVTYGFQEFFQRSRNACCTAGWTKSETSPPRRAISRTRDEEMKLYCSAGVRNRVSASGIKCRFMLASWNSYSKSDTARRPRRITPAPVSRTKSASSEAKPRTSTLAMPSSAVRASAMRSSNAKPGLLPGLSAMPTISRSNSGAARPTRSA